MRYPKVPDEIYLLYAGHSEDGRGNPNFVARTTDVHIAIAHETKCRTNPYSIGDVRLMTETSITRVDLWDLDTKLHGKTK